MKLENCESCPFRGECYCVLNSPACKAKKEEAGFLTCEICGYTETNVHTIKDYPVCDNLTDCQCRLVETKKKEIKENVQEKTTKQG